MNAPLPHPLRVLVKGSSLVVMTPEWNGERGEYTVPRWVQNGLLDRGRACELANQGVSGELTRHAFRTFEDDVLAGAPDVAIYGYAYYECIHALLPNWLERHVNRYDGRTGPVRTRYRGWLLRPTWKVLAQTQRLLDRLLADRLFGRRVHRITQNYELLIRRTRTLGPGSPLVFVLALLGPGGQAGDWFPGMSARIDRMNRALSAMVDRIDDPQVRLAPVPWLVEQLDPPEDPVPDGMHYSPRMRRIIGDWIAGEIDAALPSPRA